MAEYALRKRDLLARQEILQGQLDTLNERMREGKHRQDSQASLLQALDSFHEEFTSKPLRCQKLLLREIVEQVRVDHGQVEIIFRHGLLTAAGRLPAPYWRGELHSCQHVPVDRPA